MSDGLQRERVVAAVCSRDRPVMLRRCLERLKACPVPEDWDFQVLVIDNSSPGIASEYRALADEFGDFVLYAREEKPGLTYARNKALDVAVNESVSWLIFMDDDEWPDDGWLQAYRNAMDDFQFSTVFSGPARLLDQAGQFFKTPFRQREEELTYGVPLTEAYTNNVAIHIPMLKESGLRFDLGFNFTGGEDSEFFRRLRQHGYTQRWVPDAIVYEEVIPDRFTARYLFKRVFRNEINKVRIDRELNPSFRPVKCFFRGFRRTLDGSLALLIGSLAWLPNRRFSKRAFDRGVHRVAAGCGLIAGLFGYVVEPYRVTDGE